MKYSELQVLPYVGAIADRSERSGAEQASPQAWRGLDGQDRGRQSLTGVEGVVVVADLRVSAEAVQPPDGDAGFSYRAGGEALAVRGDRGGTDVHREGQVRHAARVPAEVVWVVPGFSPAGLPLP